MGEGIREVGTAFVSVLNVENVMNTFQRSPISTDIFMEAKTGMAVISILVMFVMIIFAQAGNYQNICQFTKNMNAINVKKYLPVSKVWKLILPTVLKILVQSVGKRFVTSQT